MVDVPLNLTKKPTFHSISLKVNTIARLNFKLGYFDVTVQHVRGLPFNNSGHKNKKSLNPCWCLGERKLLTWKLLFLKFAQSAGTVEYTNLPPTHTQTSVLDMKLNNLMVRFQ